MDKTVSFRAPFTLLVKGKNNSESLKQTEFKTTKKKKKKTIQLNKFEHFRQSTGMERAIDERKTHQDRTAGRTSQHLQKLDKLEKGKGLKCRNS